MAMSFRYLGFSCIILLALQQMATGLQCYVCTNCDTPTGLQTVSSGASGYSCTKTTSKVAGSVVSISRSFTLTSTCREANDVILDTGIIYNCCTTDKCNAGVALSSSLTLALALVAVVNVFKKVMAN